MTFYEFVLVLLDKHADKLGFALGVTIVFVPTWLASRRL